MTVRIASDVGGTFTDSIAYDPASRRVAVSKVPTTPEGREVGTVEGLRVALGELRLTGDAVAYVGHGMTTATNAVIQRSGARTAFITNRGFKDLLLIGRQDRPSLYDVSVVRTPPLVPRELCYGIGGRLDFNGHEIEPLDEAALADAAADMRSHDVEAVAVAFLHAYANPHHERAAKALLERHLPGAAISISSDILREMREFERASTTVLNAYLAPVMDRYLGALTARLQDRDAGLGTAPGTPVMVMEAAGGLMTVETARARPVHTVLSGPAGGVIGAAHIAQLAGADRAITMDIGGTSTDISLIRDGRPETTRTARIGQIPVRLPAIDIVAIGAGGGSIAWIDDGGALRVGPISAEAVPGPASYGRGGTRPTVTDANLVRGLLDPGNFLGGRITLDTAAARRAVESVAKALDTDALTAAEGIGQVVNTNMAEGIKLVSVRRGVDPRGFTLVAFGGAAGLHVTEVARLLEIRRVIVPSVAAVLSAWGMLATDLRYELVRSHVSEVGRLSAARLRRLFAGLEAQGRRQLRGFEGTVEIRRALDMRYGEQIFEIGVPLDGVDLARADLLDEVAARFHRRHEELYAYSAPGQEVVIVNARVAVVGRLPVLPADDAVATGRALGPPVRRRVWLGGWQEVPVYRLDALPAGHEVKGPALFESATTTVLIRDAEQATVTPRGWLDIQLG
jgi:N-methylhydantoinase A